MIQENTIVSDIGSGTGIFTLQMSPLVGEIFAVEPNEDMRDKAEMLYKDFSNIVSVNGTAEATTLENTKFFTGILSITSCIVLYRSTLVYESS